MARKVQSTEKYLLSVMEWAATLVGPLPQKLQLKALLVTSIQNITKTSLLPLAKLWSLLMPRFLEKLSPIQN